MARPADPEAHLLPKVRRRWLEQQQREQLRRALEDQDIDPEEIEGCRAQGDPSTLRGIPVVGVRGGFGGAVKGTRPGERELQ